MLVVFHGKGPNHHGHGFLDVKGKQVRQCMHNVTLKRVHETIVAEEKQ
jgi:hypothetical protein